MRGSSSSLHRRVVVILQRHLVWIPQAQGLFTHGHSPLTQHEANPTLLGLIGFLVPYTSTVLILCGFQGALAPQSLIGLSGDYYFFGALAMNVAGIAEFILGNSM